MRRQLTPKRRSSLYHPSVPRLGSPDVAETSELRFSQYRIFKNKDSGKHRLGTSGQKYTDEEQTQDHGHSPGSTSRVNTWGLSEIQSLRRRGKGQCSGGIGGLESGEKMGFCPSLAPLPRCCSRDKQAETRQTARSWPLLSRGAPRINTGPWPANGLSEPPLRSVYVT